MQNALKTNTLFFQIQKDNAEGYKEKTKIFYVT